MNAQFFRILLLLCCCLPAEALSQSSASEQLLTERIVQLERRLSDMERKANASPHRRADAGIVVILFGAFCALWAQNTGRNPWLWFFLGLLFSAVAVFFVLTKNANDRFDRAQRERLTRGLT